MGSGLSFTCKKCGNNYRVHWGIGIFYPQVYKGVVENIKNGEYGQEWKALFSSKEYVAVEAAICVYHCKKCHSWRDEPDFSLYEPNSLEEIRKMQNERNNDDEWGAVPCGSFKEDYHILKRRIHYCTNCGEEMQKLMTYEELQKLPCPQCGNIPEEEDSSPFMWD